MAQTKQISGNIVYEPQNTKRAAKNILLVIAAVTLAELLLLLALWFFNSADSMTEIFPGHKIMELAFFGNGKQIITADNNSVAIWQNTDNKWKLIIGPENTNELPAPYSAGPGPRIPISRDGNYIVMQDGDEKTENKTTLIFKKEGDGWELLQTIPIFASPNFSPDSNYLVLHEQPVNLPMSGSESARRKYFKKLQLHIYEKENGKWSLCKTIKGFARSFFSPDSKYLFLEDLYSSSYSGLPFRPENSDGNKISVLENKNGNWAHIQEIRIPEIAGIAFSPQGKFMAVVGNHNEDIFIYEIQKGIWQKKTPINHPKRKHITNWLFAISDDGIFVLASYSRHNLLLYDINTDAWTSFYDDDIQGIPENADFRSKYAVRISLKGLSDDARLAAYVTEMKQLSSVVVIKRTENIFKKFKSFQNTGFKKIEHCAFSPESDKLAVYGKGNDGRPVIKIFPLDEAKD